MIRPFHRAKGSNAELLTQLIIANEIGYVDIFKVSALLDDCDRISAMLSKLIAARSRT